jgi:hypothetical protein
MFEQFSAGYYLGRLYVHPHEGGRALLRATHHRTVRRQLYGADAPANGTHTDTDGQRTAGADAPLVMRYRRQHFVVDGEADLPERTLLVPGEWLDPDHDTNEPCEVFLAKADRAEQLLRVATPTDGGESGADGDRSGGSDEAPPGNPFVPGSLDEVARPGFRPQ